MKAPLCLLLALALTACGPKIVYVDPPALPDLPPEVEATCPTLAAVPDRSIAALALADVESSGLYAKCKARGDAVVSIYNEAKAARAKAAKVVVPTTQK